MKKLVIVASALLLVLGVFGNAGAFVFTDTTTFYGDDTDSADDLDDYGRGQVNKLEGLGDYVVWTHHFAFDPAAAEVNSGTLTLYLYDDDSDKWWNPITWEVGFGWAQSGSWAFEDVDTETYHYDVDISYLTDGEFQVTLCSIGGDFYIDHADLEIDYTPVPAPESASMLLLGLGLIGLAGARRKLKR